MTSTETPPVDATVASSSQGAEHHFQTDHLHEDLKGRSIRGGVVSLVAQAIRFVLQMGSTAILARLLTPADFGLVAMVTALTGFMWLFSDMGLSAVTVQQTEINQQQVSSLFWFNVIFSIGLAVVSIALSPVVAWFYAEPRLIGLMDVLSISFILGGLTAQHYALLMRRMHFGAAAFIQAASFTAGAIVGIILATLGWGYWSLVGMVIGSSLAAAILSWMFSGWRPSSPMRSAKLGTMLGFGGALTGSSILTFAVRNLDNLIVGRVSGPDALGLYSKAYGLVLLPVKQIIAPLTGVLMPVLSRLQDEPVRYRKYYLEAIGLLALISMPIVAFIFADAHALVLTLLGPKWMQAVPFFQFLAPGAFVGTVAGTTDWVLISLGQASRLLKWYAVSAPPIILSFLVGIHWGAAGVATSFSIFSCVLVIPNFWWALRDSPIRLIDAASALWRPTLASILAAGIQVEIVSGRLFKGLPPVELTIDAVIYFCVYALILPILPGGRSFFTNTVAILTQRSVKLHGLDK